MSNIVDFELYKETRNMDPLLRYQSEISVLIRDINISIDPTSLTTDGHDVIIEWMTMKGTLIVTFTPKAGALVIDAASKDESIVLDDVLSSVTHHNRWVGYFFDDNFT